MPELSDQVLILRCINGDKSAWDRFVERFSPLIYWAIREGLNRASYSYSQEDLQDIFQNVFVLLWEKGKLVQIRDREKVSGWLVMVAANCALNYFRKKREALVKDELVLEQIPSSDCSAAETVEQEKLSEILEKVFNFLSAREQIIIKLNYLYDKTHQQISEILNMPLNTVSTLIKRTKEKLKEELKRQGWENL